MMTSAECRAKAVEARAHAASHTDQVFRTHYEAMADGWDQVAFTALKQEAVEAGIEGRRDFSA